MIALCYFKNVCGHVSDDCGCEVCELVSETILIFIRFKID